MHLPWFWIPPGALALLVIFQQVRIYRIHRDSKKREELFQIVTENAADMIALVDVKGRRLYNSPAYKRILGYSAAELGETSAFEQIHPDDRFRVLEAAREARESGVGKQLEYRVKHKDGSWRVLESLANTIRDSQGQVAKLVIVNRDITERKHAEQQLEHNLFHDPLTGLSTAEWSSTGCKLHLCARGEIPVGPIAWYSPISTISKSSTKPWERSGRSSAAWKSDAASESACGKTIPWRGARAGRKLCCRGWAETNSPFCSASVSDPSDAMRVAKRIQEAVAEPFNVDSREVRVSVSVGIALSTSEHERPEDVLKDADVAMRRAKALGGSRCEVFDEAMHTRAVGRLRLEADLRTAIAEGQFRVYYQPIVSSTRGASSASRRCCAGNIPRRD